MGGGIVRGGSGSAIEVERFLAKLMDPTPPKIVYNATVAVRQAPKH